MTDKKVQLATIELQKKQLDLQSKQLDSQIASSKVMQQAVEQGLPLLKEYVETKVHKLESPKFKWSILIFGSILLICVIGSGVLVFFDKLDSGSFTFLLGTLIGGMITFLGDVILPPQQ